MLQLVGEGHGDEGDARDEIADIEEEETSQERVCGPQNSGSLVITPDSPEGGAEVPEGVHGGGPGHAGDGAGVLLVECLKWRLLTNNCDS